MLDVRSIPYGTGYKLQVAGWKGSYRLQVASYKLQVGKGVTS